MRYGQCDLDKSHLPLGQCIEAASCKADAGLQLLNDRHAEELKKLLSRNNQPADDAAFISIDRLGTDVRVRHGNEYSIERLGFDFVS